MTEWTLDREEKRALKCDTKSHKTCSNKTRILLTIQYCAVPHLFGRLPIFLGREMSSTFPSFHFSNETANLVTRDLRGREEGLLKKHGNEEKFTS